MQVMMIINPITILEDNVIIPVSVYGGLSEDRVSSVTPHYLDFYRHVTTTDSLCISTFCGSISWILYEICSTSIKS